MSWRGWVLFWLREDRLLTSDTVGEMRKICCATRQAERLLLRKENKIVAECSTLKIASIIQ